MLTGKTQLFPRLKAVNRSFLRLIPGYPKQFVHGFVTFIITHAINFYLSIRRLFQLAHAMPSLRFLVTTSVCVIVSCTVTTVFLPHNCTWFSVLVCGGLYISLLAFLLLITGTWNEKDHLWLRHALCPGKQEK